ncbi:hypothetical protein HPB50_021386 [Hyalomma asiaticum]|uniref:Uncharacterized protein n=1 Tax=Hyalomma asiaticum TaxID=266040 RepID=A0ACB7RK91_HYAAI|nr:hypothetical protein HPB50_021386 [Hyalomma asiaticum]
MNYLDVQGFVRPSTGHAALAHALGVHILERSNAMLRTRLFPSPGTPASQASFPDTYRPHSSIFCCYQCNEIGSCSRDCERHIPSPENFSMGCRGQDPTQVVKLLSCHYGSFQMWPPCKSI